MRSQMKEHWQHRSSNSIPAPHAIDAMLQPALPGARVLQAQAVGGGLSTTLVKLWLAGREQPVVLRSYTRDREACAREARIAALIGDSVPVPAVLYADPQGEATGTPYMLLAWVDGVRLADLLRDGTSDDARSALRSAGEMLAAIGEFRFAAPGFLDHNLDIAAPLEMSRQVVVAYTDVLLARGAAAHLGPELAARLHDFIEREAPALDIPAADSRLVHFDYNPPNLLLRPDGDGWRVAAVLDWEFAASSRPLCDIGNMLREERRFPPGAAQAFADGFREAGGELPPRWRQLARLLDLLALLDFLARPAVAAVVVQDVSALIQTTVTRPVDDEQ